jgi:hypothetical protein
MGSATPGLGARVRAARDAGQEFDIIEYCREKGLGAPHTYLRGAFDRDACGRCTKSSTATTCA